MRSVAGDGATISLSNQSRISLPKVVPGDKQERADKAQMLEKRVLDHEPLRLWNLPEAIGNERRRLMNSAPSSND
jgi:hypothetical protein